MTDLENSSDGLARTVEERAAIERLRKLAKAWPQSLTLFSWNGSLTVVRTEDRGDLRTADEAGRTEVIRGIPNDGGDP